jgi:hypothetical protein
MVKIISWHYLVIDYENFWTSVPNNAVLIKCYYLKFVLLNTSNRGRWYNINWKPETLRFYWRYEN